MTHRKIICPTCTKQTIYDLSNPFRPFCSKRCQLIDLGAWATEEHVITEQNYLLDDFDIDQYDGLITDQPLH